MPEVEAEGPPPGMLHLRVETLERDLISDALKRSGGRVVDAAEELGVTERTVRYKMKKLGLERWQFTSR